MAMSESELDRRIAAAQARAAGIEYTPDKVEDGTEPLRKMGRQDGRVEVTVKSVMSREEELAARNALNQPGGRQFRNTGGQPERIRMPDTSLLPQPESAIMIGSTLVWPANDGGFGSQTAIYAQAADGDVQKRADAVATLIYESLLAGGKVSLPKSK